MNTELSFLLELLLTHKLSKVTREAITNRIKEVEMRLIAAPTSISIPHVYSALNQSNQPLSTQRILERNPDLTPPSAGAPSAPSTPSLPVQIAQTPAAAQALADRQAKIAMVTSDKYGKLDKAIKR